MQKLQPRQAIQRSDIDRYFEGPIVSVNESLTKEDWLLLWRRVHRNEYPCMAAAARDYLAIPATEVAVEII